MGEIKVIWLDDVVITKSNLWCRYCGEHIEGTSDSEVLLEMIYHMHEKHGGNKQ